MTLQYFSALRFMTYDDLLTESFTACYIRLVR